MKTKIKAKPNKIFIFLFGLFVLTTMIHLVLEINLELGKEYNKSLSSAERKEIVFFNDLKSYSTIGWFNLVDFQNYNKGADFVFICFQYLVAPTILENYGYNKLIICYYTSPVQLAAFCKKNKKYRLIKKDIFTNFALLERFK
jgi:hypothetical protein